MSKTKALLYAELLSNIRQVSIIAALETPCNRSTSVQLSSDGKQFILHHEGSLSSVILPSQVVQISQLQKPVLGSQELSWRLPLSPNCVLSSNLAQSNDVPWSSKHFLQTGGEFSYCCRQCGCIVVEKGVIKMWKDLPSENWAEMMEFWHCHKPDVHEDGHDGSSDIAGGGEASQTTRGYGANTKLAAQSGTCFVDLTTFLLSETDCPSLSAESNSPNRTSTNNKPLKSSSNNQTIQCHTCSRYIGYLDSTFSGLRLHKWRVSALNNSSSSQSTSSALSAPSLSSLLCTQLQSIIASQNTAKIVLLPSTSFPPTSGTQSTTLLLWVLSSGIRFSSSAVSGSLGMKIFFRDISDKEIEGMVDSGKVEEIALPLEAIVDIGGLLRESGALLPPSARKFREWNVGVLEKYEEK